LAPTKRADAIIGEQIPGKFISHLVRGLKSESPVADWEDIRQDALEGLCKAAIRFDPASGTAFRTFAWSRVRGSAIDGVRKVNGTRRRVRRAVQSLDREENRRAANQLADTSLSTEEQAASSEGVRRIWQLMQELPDPQRTVMALRVANSLTDRQIAEALGIQDSRATALRQEAQALLRERLSEEGEG